MRRIGLCGLLLTTAVATPILAQDNLETLQGMQRTDATFTRVEQTGPTADALKAIVPHINLPDGFEASLYAVVPDARSMAVAPQGTVVFVGTRKDKVWSVLDRDRNRVADEVMDFAPSLTFDIPNGPCFSPDGFLYIAERNRVLFLPGRRVLLRGAGPCRGYRRRQGRSDPGRGGKLQPHRPGVSRRS